jgi:D-alanyl-D-alanine dipeptidase
MLNAAQASLPANHKLQIGTCLRTLSMQQHGWDNYNRKMRELHPEWPVSTLRRAVNKYFAPYDQPAPPGHCTGGAVDVSLLGPDGQSMDLLGPTKGWEAAYTWSDKIGDVAKANRMLMVEAMMNAGFSNCRDEYWHYSWGDSGWAVRTGVSESPYGWSHPPVCLDIQTPEGAALIEHVHTVRDQDGRPVRADAEVRAASDASPAGDAAGPRIRFRVNWSNGIPLTIRVHGISAQVSKDLRTFYTCDGGEVWESVDESYSEGDTVVLLITPRVDRVVLSNFLSAPAP